MSKLKPKSCELHCIVTVGAGGVNRGAANIIVRVPTDANGLPILPAKLSFCSFWIYDLTNGRILKNKMSVSVVPCIDAVQVDHNWLSDNGFTVRM